MDNQCLLFQQPSSSTLTPPENLSQAPESLELIDRDTNFFGFRIPKVTNRDASLNDLQAIKRQMTDWKINLAYWVTSECRTDIENVTPVPGAHRVEEKLTFVAQTSKSHDADSSAHSLVESFGPGMSLSDMKYLAIENGIHSRFIVDPQFPKDQARAMFKEWILRSISRSIADDVLVICRKGQVLGMATVARKLDYASIGLVAVADVFRGCGYGTALV